jgi:hypothetical protein
MARSATSLRRAAQRAGGQKRLAAKKISSIPARQRGSARKSFQNALRRAQRARNYGGERLIDK